MRESKIPIEQRFLTIQGKVNPESCEKVIKDFSSKMSPTKLCCFVSYAYETLPLGKTFDISFSYSEPDKYVETILEISLITQQFSEEWDSIPQGWKTVCIFNFPKGVPKLFLDLPTADGWGEVKSKDCICICNKENYEEIKKHLEFKIIG
jgi:hypothetical protein